MPSQAVAVRGSATVAFQSTPSTQVKKTLTFGCVCPGPFSKDDHRVLSSSSACSSYSGGRLFGRGFVQQLFKQKHCRKAEAEVRAAAAPVGLGPEGDDDEEGADLGQGASSQDFRNRLNAMMEDDSQSFRGADLANLIREKYGRSYDAIFIQKEFMGRKLLALNIMWKYQEQRSFPLTEDEYIYRLDGIAETLREWGAVSMVKSSLKTTREKPRIGKAVSLMIDPELLGARGNEWLTN